MARPSVLACGLGLAVLAVATPARSFQHTPTQCATGTAITTMPFVNNFALCQVVLTGNYRFQVWGANGGTEYANTYVSATGGLGAMVSATLSLPANAQLMILSGGVGGLGPSSNLSENPGGGGGGSYVVMVTNSGLVPLIVAGGGGGAGYPANGLSGQGLGAGNTASGGGSGGGSDAGAGGSPGNPGAGAIDNSGGAGGAGWSGNGGSGPFGSATGGMSFANGAAGGTVSEAIGGYGGLGGGGAGGSRFNSIRQGGGGGGGWSGGGGGGYTFFGPDGAGGGGGGSYVAAAAQDVQSCSGCNTLGGFGNGRVTIQFVGASAN